MPKYPISTILWLAKLSIKDKIQDTLKLHNNIDAYITIVVKDKNGKIIKQHKQHSHSFVANFLDDLIFLTSQSAGKGINLASTSIQIGTGTTPPSPSDTALADPISNGTGANEMQYPSAPTYSSVIIKGDTSYFTLQSTITNNSGASITVSEVGWIGGTTNSGFSGMLTHDLLSSPVTVPNGTAITITYTISVTT